MILNPLTSSGKIRLIKGNLDKDLIELVYLSEHETLAIWAGDCAERVLPLFEKHFPNDKNPRMALQACRKWVKTGYFKMADVRKLSLDAHESAKLAIEFPEATCAAHSCAYASATSHVKTQSIGSALFALKAINEKKVDKEKLWQYNHLVKLNKKSK